jgi:tetrahydrodipicolinate N-succinyltransferase
MQVSARCAEVRVVEECLYVVRRHAVLQENAILMGSFVVTLLQTGLQEDDSST